MEKHNNNNMLPDLSGLQPLSRRSFLRATALTGMVVTTGLVSGCSTLLGKKAAPEKLHYASLKPDEVSTFSKLVDVYLPTDKFGLPSSTSQVPTLKNIDYMVARMSTQTRDLLGLGLWVLEYRPMASFKFSRFSKMDTAKASEYVRVLQQGNFVERGLLTSIMSVVGVNYWRDPQTWDGLNYWGPVSTNWGVVPLGNAPLPTV